MEIQKLKSQNPKIYDSTETDLIIVSPSVLENKLRDFEEHYRFKGSLVGDIALAVTLIIAVVATDFRDFLGLGGATIKGAFLFGFIVIVIRIILGSYKAIIKDGKNREDIINELKNVDNKANKIDNSNKNIHADSKTK